ncbi:unnamed protein product [Cylindrotheca closterium]|uniref:Uncharacterized protein n=1 Tax=Cylindrotheca closterium TaxID=2856 RepID=A0AAD2CNL8_9STRA|nr:unnamed protein product [Cylindrotheca closterium]
MDHADMDRQNMSYYKDALVEKVGGQRHYDFAVINYCERIRKDHRVKFFFAHLDLRGLIRLQKDFLDGALLNLPMAETEIVMGYLVMKYQILWQMGMDEAYFNILKAHLVEALRDCWFDEKLVKLFDKHYESLRPLFQNKGNLISPKKTEKQVAVDRIQLTATTTSRTKNTLRRQAGGATGIQRRS